MIKTLLKSVKQYKKQSVLCPLFMVGEAVMEIIIPFFMTFIVGEFEQLAKGKIDGIDTKKIVIYAVLMIVCAVFALLCGVMGGRLAAKASCGFAHNLREDMYNNLQTFSFANIDNYSTASLITRITTDVTNVQNAYQMAIRMLVRAPILFIASIIMTVIIEPVMALIFGCAAVSLGIVVSVCMIKVVPYFRTMFRKYDDLNAVVQENLTAIRVVKSYVRENTEIAKMRNATGEVYKYSVKAERILTVMMPCVTLVMFIVNLLIIALGANMETGAISGNVSPSQIQTLIQYSAQILSGVIMVAMCLNFISLSKGSMDRICEVLNERTTLPKPQNPVFEVKDGSVIFENVSFAYSQKSDVSVLNNINLEIKSGETVGIIGATGSGKTSLVSLIPRLYDATVGTVKVGGVDVKQYNMDTLRNKVAMVLQKNVLFSGTILDNLRWGDASATEEECKRACRLACADEFIEKLPDGYETYIEQGGANVSGGQKQRAAVARALITRPQLILADEPTGALDSRAADGLLNLFKTINEDGQTILMVTHSVKAASSANRVLFIKDGEVFHQLYRGNLTNEQMYQKISDTLTVLATGGDRDE